MLALHKFFQLKFEFYVTQKIKFYIFCIFVCFLLRYKCLGFSQACEEEDWDVYLFFKNRRLIDIIAIKYKFYLERLENL